MWGHCRLPSALLGVLVGIAVSNPAMVVASANNQEYPRTSRVVTLDGSDWLLAVDPQNVGRAQKWFEKPRPEAKPCRVPWIMQGHFPEYHGVAWYWRRFRAPNNPHPGGRFLLRFGAVDYLAEVWLNGNPVGSHEGGETPFVLDVTDSIRAGEENLMAVRVLNPTNEPIDGFVLAQTARRCKVVPFSAGAYFNHGGIVGPVELILSPQVRVADLFVTAPLPKGARDGKVCVEVLVRNAGPKVRPASLEVSVAPASGGETLALGLVQKDFPPGDTTTIVELSITQPRCWELNDPFLYRATARVSSQGLKSLDERSTRFGFRDFRLANGYFRLNGRRLYLRSTHTCNHFPIGLQLPHDPDLLRRDLLNLKAMGFNAVRFIWGGATPTQLDFCDEIGLLVYEESYASMPIADSQKMIQRFETNVSELIRRDRNHPSVVIWGLLNEAPNDAAFRHAVALLPQVRRLDPTRMVFLNSGRYDGVSTSAISRVAGLRIWPREAPTEPWVAVNASSGIIRELGITWPPGQLALHPGPGGEYSAVRWTAPAAGRHQVDALFQGIAERATTDVHVLHNGRSLFQAGINIRGGGNEARFAQGMDLAAGDKLDFTVGYGNGSYGADTTALTLMIRTPGGKTHNAATEFSTRGNPNGAWTYGLFTPAPLPAANTFAPYPTEGPVLGPGSLSNPGSAAWEDVIDDRHVYPRVPHTADILDSLRRLDGGRRPVFLSEYGIGSAVDLWRAVRHFEQHRAERLEDARFFQDKLNQFLADYQRWHLEGVFPRPEDFFAASLRKMAGQRLLGLNAIRSNPKIIGHSLTGAIDHVMCGEGLTTLFRELKPGTVDALFEAWAPLRWCLFAEPGHVRRGGRIRLEAVLANEDVMAPGDYPARFLVVGPDQSIILDRMLTVTIPRLSGKGELPLALPCFREEITIRGPEGKYRFLATFQRGAAAAGGETEFHVTDPSRRPGVPGEVVLWGDDPLLARWLADHGIRTRPFRPGPPPGREVILGASKPPAPGGVEAFRELVGRIARGSTAIFLCPEVFAQGNQPTRWLPLARKGTLTPIHGWLYLKDEWAREHPVFDGLPSGGLMDYTFFREIIPDLLWMGQDPPAEAVAGAIKASQDYASGLMVSIYPLGGGRFLLNTLRIRENLDHPAAQCLLKNMLRYAARDSEKPLVDLPGDFEARIKAMGFRSP